MEDFYKVGEKWLKTAAETTSNIASTTSSIVATSGARALEYIGSSSGRPEVPARAAVAAAVARQIASLPPHERLSFSSTSLGSPSVYGARPGGKIAEELEENFYEEGFDPVRHMLEHLPKELSEINQQYFDTKGGGRLLQLDMITERLSKQVMENHEEMVKGMQLVTELDRDLQLTNIICKNGRRFLSMAAQEVTHDLLVASNVKKKQVLLDLLSILERIQLAIETKSRLDSIAEDGDYALALQLCSECVVLLEECSSLNAITDVNHSLEDWLQKTIDNVDRMLLAVCHNFNSDQFASVLLAYVVLGDVPGLAEKAQTLYAQTIVSETHAVIRNLLFEGQDPQVLLQKSRIPYNDLCAQLSEAKFKECLHRSLEVLFNLLSSYYEMMTWKPLVRLVSASNQSVVKGSFSFLKLGKHDEVVSNGEASADEDVIAGEDHQDGPPARLRDAMLSVARTLERGRKTVWELSARRVAVLLSCDALCTTSPHQFLQSLDWVNKFILAGEAFCGVEAMTLRAKLVKQSEKYYWTFHRQNLEVLRMILGKELWQQISSPKLKMLYLSGLVNGTTTIKASHGVESQGGSSRLEGVETSQLTRREKSTSRASFDEWLRKGNPFTDKKVNRLGSGKADENGIMRSGSDDYQKTGDEEGEGEDLLADFIDEDSQLPGRLLSEYRQNSPKSAQAHAEDGSLVLTSSAVNLLRYMDKYIKLMQILQPIVSEIFRGLCQLFELYIFTVFKVFGNRDFLTGSLRFTLVRISQGLEEQRVQLPSPTSPNRTSSTVASISAASSNLPIDLPPTSGGTVLSMVPSNLYGLKERAVAVESLLCLSQILQKSHSHFRTMLPQDTLTYMEQFFLETVEVVPDLRVHIYKVAARSILNLGGMQQRFWADQWEDPAHSLNYLYHTLQFCLTMRYVDRIANSRWELKELGIEHNGYVDLLLGEFKQYTNKLSQGTASMELREAMLEYGVDVLAETILEGLSRVKRCNNEGRALMSLDLQVLINGLHHLAPAKLKANLLIVETYIKAFYLPETEYFHWMRAHPEYTKGQVVGLINLVASTYNWKRKTRTDLLEKIETGDP